jgi:23S rRNA (pseudouridine1915-N3)-methyltransferase
MKITLIVVGKTESGYLEEGIGIYAKRLPFYRSFEMAVIPALRNSKNLSEAQQKQKEGEAILARLSPTDYVVLLDENGKLFSSLKFSEWVFQKEVTGIKNLIFIVGGPFGFSSAVYQRANDKIALSPMTFSHQLVRLVFVEQLYRAMTIIKGEPYHHQ